MRSASHIRGNSRLFVVLILHTMQTRSLKCGLVALLVLASVSVGSLPVTGQDRAALVSDDEIVELNAKLTKAVESASAARKKLAIRRVIREVEALIKKHPSAPNRYELLNTLFRSQQVLVGLDDSATNRRVFLATCEKLAAAPNDYAALRLDADLLLTQAKSARKGGDSHARSDALRPLVERYRDTEVEAKVIRIAMIMGLELGNTRLVNDLRRVVAERFHQGVVSGFDASLFMAEQSDRTPPANRAIVAVEKLDDDGEIFRLQRSRQLSRGEDRFEIVVGTVSVVVGGAVFGPRMDLGFRQKPDVPDFEDVFLVRGTHFLEHSFVVR